MAAILDSVPVFKSRVIQFGLDGLWDAMGANGWQTWGNFAFATAWTPGAADDTEFQTAVVTALLGFAPTPPMAATLFADFAAKKVKLKRLFVEAYTLYTADLQRKVSRPDDDDRPRKLAKEERAERLDQIKNQLSILELDDEPELIPSHRLTDTLATMQDTGELKPIAWEDLTNRDQERKGKKKDPTWTLDKQGVLVLVTPQDSLTADTSNEARIRFTLMRRGVAMQMARLANWSKHQKIVKFLMKEYTRVQPADFQPVTIQQVYTADQEIFLWLAEKTEGGLDPLPGGQYPLDHLIEQAIAEPRIKALLNPFPKAHRGGGGQKRDSAELSGLAAENKRLKESLNKARAATPGGKSKGKGSGKPKGNKKDDAIRVPKELIGLPTTTRQGKRFCFTYNLGGCQGGNNCPRGEHKCMKPGCESSSHGFRDHV